MRGKRSCKHVWKPGMFHVKGYVPCLLLSADDRFRSCICSGRTTFPICYFMLSSVHEKIMFSRIAEDLIGRQGRCTGERGRGGSLPLGDEKV